MIVCRLKIYGLNEFKISSTKTSGKKPFFSKTLLVNSFSKSANFLLVFTYSFISSVEISYFLNSLKVFKTSISVLK